MQNYNSYSLQGYNKKSSQPNQMANKLLEKHPTHKNSGLEIGKKEIKNYLAQVLAGHLIIN